MRNPKAITISMQLYFSGESLRGVQKFLRLQGIEVSHQTIYNWINKYTNLMKNYVDKITPQVGDAWRADELYLKIKGNTKYLYALMDDETRFWIAKQVADTKYKEDIQPLFKEGKAVTGTKPQVLITDGARNFEEGFRKEFWERKGVRPVHVRHIHFKNDMNNNKMERMNGEFRDREKIVRGLKKMDSPMFDGYQIYHNYIRPHMGLDGATPADKAGIEIKGKDKWETLIQNASQL
jgi:putative transposase